MLPKTNNTNEDLIIDAVIPAHIKDKEILDHCIKGIRKNVKNIRRIIVVSKERYSDLGEWFDEKLYPFSFQEISQILNNQNVGWNYQQLLKLYAVLVIPNISKNVLIVDADTVFYRQVSFFDQRHRALYNLAKDKNLFDSPFQINTLQHIRTILPQVSDKLAELFSTTAKNNPQRAEEFIKKLNFVNPQQRILAKDLESGICHHMLMQKNVIESLFATVESNYKNQKFYQVFLQNRQNNFGVAEYNLYFYFLITHFKDSYAIRILNYKNTAKFQPVLESIRRKYHYCSYHSYMRKENFFSIIKKFFLKKINKIFIFEQWNIGFCQNQISDIFQNNLKVTWLQGLRNYEFRADPFIFFINQQQYLIFEKYSLFQKRGSLFLAEINKNIISNEKLLFDNKKHCSYPCVFEENDKILIVFEAYKTNRLELFELEKKNLSLVKIRDIFIDKAIVDPTLFKHQDNYFLFYSLAQNPNQNLQIAYASSLEADFVDHPQNPVKTDIANSRSAGAIFCYQNKIYRPAQNSTITYGQSLVINEIKILDKQNFREEKIVEINAKNLSPFNIGLHTLNIKNNLIVIDGKRNFFLWYKPIIAIIRKIKNCLSIRN